MTSTTTNPSVGTTRATGIGRRSRQLLLIGLTIAPLATGAVLAGAGPASAFVPDAIQVLPAASANPAATRIPIRVSVSGTVTRPDSSGKFTAKGTGTMKGYGRVHFSVTGTLDANRSCPSFTGTESIQVIGTGDELTGQVIGDGCGQSQNPAVLDVRAFIGVTSGTGHFSGADGSWLVTGTLNASTWTFSHQLTGLVLVPAH